MVVEYYVHKKLMRTFESSSMSFNSEIRFMKKSDFFNIYYMFLASKVFRVNDQSVKSSTKKIPLMKA